MRKYIMLFVSLINAAAMAAVIAMNGPDTVPIHYNLYGKVDAYASKWTFMLIAAFPILISVVFMVYRSLTKNMANVHKNSRYEGKAISIIMMFSIAICWIMAVPSLNGSESLGAYVPATICIILGILMMYISNLMAKIRQNKTFGFRTKATLADETVWKKTHRLSGYTGMAGGLILTICGIITLKTSNIVLIFCAMVIFICLVCFVPVIYSNRIYKKLEENECTK